MSELRVAIASCDVVLHELTGEQRLAAELERRGARVGFESWDDREARWGEYDLVVIRSTWDYTRKLEAFQRWVSELEVPLLNPPALVVWNSEKTYLADLERDRIPIVPTTFVAPGDPAPPLDGEIVVKPTVSAGARDTGRFAPAHHDAALELIATIQAQGRTAMVQPYLGAVDEQGETAIVLVEGEETHVLRKRAVLRPDEVAPLRDDALGAAEAMYDTDLVRAGEASEAERTLAAAVVGALAERFGEVPLFARVDMVAGPSGEPVLMELEAIEPSLYFHEAPVAAARLAEAIIARAGSR